MEILWKPSGQVVCWRITPFFYSKNPAFSCFLWTFNREVSPKKHSKIIRWTSRWKSTHSKAAKKFVRKCCANCSMLASFLCNYLEVNLRQRIPWKLTWLAGNSPCLMGDISWIVTFFSSQPTPEVELLSRLNEALPARRCRRGDFREMDEWGGAYRFWEFPGFFSHAPI